jgi:hypothetical protein
MGRVPDRFIEPGEPRRGNHRGDPDTELSARWESRRAA